MTKNQKTSNLINTVNEISTIARNRKIVHLFTQDHHLDGRNITLQNRSHIHFGSCSYLGLELDERLIEGGIDALKRYGSQFSCSRTYVSITLYEELEELLSKIFGRPVILSTSSTMGHQAVIPIIIEEGDAVILDQQAHVSMQEAVNRLQLRGITVTVLRHNRLDDLQKKIDELGPKHNKIWYFIDGVYSMYGDLAPMHELIGMMDKNKQLYLYADDAHGMSWSGIHGSGFLRSQVEFHPKMVLATSLAKGFASAGGIFVLPNEEMYWKVKNWGGPLTYSGPQQPAVLGSSIASAKVHLSEEINTLQESLAEKIKFCNEVLNHYELPLVSESPSPIFFIGLGLTKVGYNMVKRLSDEGLYTNLGIFPAVPETCTGIRFTITNHHSLSDIEQLAERIHHHLPKALKEEDRTMKDVYRAFKTLKPMQENATSKKVATENKNTDAIAFKVQHETSIHAIPKKTWDDLLADNGSFDWQGLELLEQSFKDNPKPEDNWDFHYYIITDSNDQPIIATFFTCLLTKDDMLAPEEVSKKIEQSRIDDPYYLTSKTFMMGSVLSDGEHFYIDKSHSKWKDAMMMLLDEVWMEQEKSEAEMLYLRDFHADDLEMRNFLTDQGFIKMDMPDAHVIDNSMKYLKENYVADLPYKKRYHIKHDVLQYESLFDMKFVTEATDEEIDHWFDLYNNVRNRKLELNTFMLPKKFFRNIAKSPYWDILVLNLKPEENSQKQKLPIAVGFVYKNQNYCPTIVGLDYNYLHSHKIYKQILYQFIPRALDLNSKKIYLGLTASLEKRKVGAIAVPQVAYIQMKDHYNMSLIGMVPNTKNEIV